MSQLAQIGIWSPDGADHDDATLKSDSQSLNITLWFRSIYHSTYVAAITFPDTFFITALYFAWRHLSSHHIFNISQSNEVLSSGVCRTSKDSTQPFLVSLFISHELTEIKSLSERVAVQQIKTNVAAFCSRSQHILTRGSHYITRWK